MRAVVLRAFNEPLELEEREIPAAGSGDESVVRVLACGVCHSDLHVVENYFDSPLPLVLGHEIVAEDEQLGNVLVYAPWGCGECRFCPRDRGDDLPRRRRGRHVPRRRLRRVPARPVASLPVPDRRSRPGPGGAAGVRRSDPVPLGQARARVARPRLAGAGPRRRRPGSVRDPVPAADDRRRGARRRPVARRSESAASRSAPSRRPRPRSSRARIPRCSTSSAPRTRSPRRRGWSTARGSRS